MIIDSHCHLTYEPMSLNLKETIQRANDDGVKYMLTISTEDKSFNKILNIIKKFKSVYGTYGIHPHEAKNHRNLEVPAILEKIKSSNKIIGIGETGLDFFYNHSDKNDQIQSFEKHIKAAIELNIPLIVHSRNAEKETMEILNEYKSDKLKILMHCFTGSTNFAEKLLKLDAFFSASGIITFKNSLKLQETFKFIPSSRLLIETDSPFLAPEPKRGKKNEPSFVKYTAQKLADIKKISNKELVDITSSNFNSLFN